MSKERSIVLQFTPSQLMALTDILAFYSRHPEEPQQFVDCLRNVTTTTAELLLKVMMIGRREERNSRPRSPSV